MGKWHLRNPNFCQTFLISSPPSSPFCGSPIHLIRIFICSSAFLSNFNLIFIFPPHPSTNYDTLWLSFQMLTALSNQKYSFNSRLSLIKLTKIHRLERIAHTRRAQIHPIWNPQENSSREMRIGVISYQIEINVVCHLHSNLHVEWRRRNAENLEKFVFVVDFFPFPPHSPRDLSFFLIFAYLMIFRFSQIELWNFLVSSGTAINLLPLIRQLFPRDCQRYIVSRQSLSKLLCCQKLLKDFGFFSTPIILKIGFLRKNFSLKQFSTSKAQILNFVIN